MEQRIVCENGFDWRIVHCIWVLLLLLFSVLFLFSVVFSLFFFCRNARLQSVRHSRIITKNIYNTCNSMMVKPATERRISWWNGRNKTQHNTIKNRACVCIRAYRHRVGSQYTVITRRTHLYNHTNIGRIMQCDDIVCLCVLHSFLAWIDVLSPAAPIRASHNIQTNTTYTARYVWHTERESSSSFSSFSLSECTANQK